jgi:hypothetical protein
MPTLPKARTTNASSKTLQASSSFNGILFIGKSSGGDASEQTLLREAQHHLERARALDPEGVVAPAFIHRVRPTVMMIARQVGLSTNTPRLFAPIIITRS